MSKDRNIYFWIRPVSFDFYFQHGCIGQYTDLIEAIKYIKRKRKQGYKIVDIHERGEWK